MLIVDSQIHIWAQGTPNPAHRQVSSYSAEEVLRDMDAAGVDAAVIHPPGWDPNSNQVAIEAARKYPNRLAILGHFPLDKPESRALVDTWKQQPGMLGLRFTFMQPHQRSWPTDGTMDWLWPAAAKAGLPVGLAAGAFLPALAGIAMRHPGVKLIIDHMGRPAGSKDDAAFANLAELLTLSQYPNIAVKLSGAPGNSSHPYPYKNIHAYIRQIFDAFGPRRCFWGTDITRMPCSWRQCVTMFTEELPWLKGRDLELVMGRALCDWIGWNLPDKP
jgi:predicted TIM-barrel fold metal-dependent hydrolase